MLSVDVPSSEERSIIDALPAFGFGCCTGRIEHRGLRKIDGRDSLSHYQHAHSEIRELIKLFGKFIWQAHAAMRCRTARQFAGVQRNTRPGNSLHIGHRRIVIEIGVVILLLLHDAVRFPEAFRSLSAPLETGASNILPVAL